MKYVHSSTLIISDVLEMYYLYISKNMIFSNIVPIPFVLDMYWMYNTLCIQYYIK
jgi:hypothetical protein